MTTRTSRGAALCALLATTALASPALAQGTEEASPVRYQRDANGVDLARAEHSLTRTEIAIGPEGPGGLALVRQFGRYVSRTNYDLRLFDSGSTVRAEVGFSSHEFSLSGGTYTATDGSGAALAKSGNLYTLTSADGIEIVYDATKTGTSDTLVDARATGISYPTGEKVTMAFAEIQYCSNIDPLFCGDTPDRKAVRLQSVSNNLGYMLHFRYASDTTSLSNGVRHASNWSARQNVKAINLADVYCSPTAHECSVAGDWPSASYVGGFTDAIGRTTTTSIDATGLGWSVRLPGSSADNLTVNYDSAGKVSSVTTNGETWTYAYGVSGDIATMVVTNPVGDQRTVKSKLSVGLPTAVTDELGRTTSYAYLASGLLDTVTAHEGNKVDYDYDARGNVIKTTAIAKDGVTKIATSAAYTAGCANILTCNQPVSTTDEGGNVTHYEYDPGHGGLLKVTQPQPAAGSPRPQTRHSYVERRAYYRNASGALVAGGLVRRLGATSTCRTGWQETANGPADCIGTADETRTIIGYQTGSTSQASNALPVSVTTEAGDGSIVSAVATTYEKLGRPETVDGPLSGAADTVRYRYNAVGQLTGTVSADPDGAGPLRNRGTRYFYHAWGRVSKVETGTAFAQTDFQIDNFTALETAETGYDHAGRKVREALIGSDGAVKALVHHGYPIVNNGDGTKSRHLCTAVRMNPENFGLLPPSACIRDTSGAYGLDRVTETVLDPLGRPSSVTAGPGTAAERTESMTYTPNGKLKTVADGENNRTTYGYDGFDRPQTTWFPSKNQEGVSSTGDYEQLVYDAVGNVDSRRLRDGTEIHFSYDGLNRVTLRNMPVGEADYTFAYDNLGAATSVSQGSLSVTLERDALGRTTKEMSLLTPTVSKATSYQYDEAGRRTRMTLDDGTFIAYDHLVTGEVKAIRENNAATGPGVLATYGYDQQGRRTSIARGNGTATSYAYDAASRLSSLTQNLAGTSHDLTLGFGDYNPAGQIKSSTRSNDVFSWVAADEAVTRTVNGLNQYETIRFDYDARGNQTKKGTTAYAYNSDNQLVSAKYNAGTASETTATLAYDPLGRLRSAVSATGTVRRFSYDGAALAAEYNGQGTLLRRFVHGPGVDEPLVQYEGTGTSDRRWLHADERGSVVAISDANGNATTVNSYDEYGKPGAANAGRFQYTGQVWLPEVGLYNYKARMYDPDEVRLMQTDPIGYEDGMNLYAYAHNDPANLTDPQGTRALTPGERLLASELSNNLPFDNIEILEASWWPQFIIGNRWGDAAVAFGNTISFPDRNTPKGGYLADFSAGTDAQRGWFIHELVHVWQSNHRPEYSPFKALQEHAWFDNPYSYMVFPDSHLDDYLWEQQAKILQDCYVNRSSPACGVALPSDLVATFMNAFSSSAPPSGTRIPYRKTGQGNGSSTTKANLDIPKKKKKK